MEQWYTIDRPLILASRSPRRREILSLLGFNFSVLPSSVVEENTAPQRVEDIEHYLRSLARAKANDVARHNPEALVLGADTVVVCDERLMGKPRDELEAAQMLRLLSDREHQVFSSVALVCGACRFDRCAVQTTAVRFRHIEPQELEDYLASKEYVDKAGAYGIQGLAMRFVEGISGCFYNVVGLPVASTIALFKEYAVRKELNHGRSA